MNQISKSSWRVNSLPPGFRKVREMKRLLTNPEASAIKGDKASAVARREVSQMVFSDGLATVSVFVEPLGAKHAEGAMHQGAMNVFSKRHGNFWLTIVGEVPSATILKIANSIEFKPDK